jgi:hypothetical protein
VVETRCGLAHALIARVVHRREAIIMGTSLFALTFRIIGPRHVERHASLVDAVNKEAIGKPWGEPRSFFLLVSEKDAGELLNSIITNSKVDENDLVCVFNLSKSIGFDHAGHGVKDLDLFNDLMKKR